MLVKNRVVVCLALLVSLECGALAPPTWPLDPALYRQNELVAWGRAKRTAWTNAGMQPTQVFENYIPVLQPVRAPSRPAIRRIQKTISSYFRIFGHDTVSSLVFTGVESANPLSQDMTYRWNSIHSSGIDQATTRAQLIASMKALGIANLRVGMNNHLIDLDDPSTWQETDSIINDFSAAGFGIVLDLHHFGIESQFAQQDAHGNVVHAQSFYLNPAWPEYYARFAKRAYERYADKVKAFTLMNEPETVAGFNGQMWHGGFPSWGAADFTSWYIARGLQVGTASVLARLAIEESARTLKHPNPLIIQTEALVYKPDFIHYNRVNRYFTSDMILSQPYLLQTDFDAIARTSLPTLHAQLAAVPIDDESILQWTIRDFVLRKPDAEQARALTTLMTQFKRLQSLHLELKQRFGLSMQDNTIFGVDYYAANEASGTSGAPLPALPEEYGRQRKQGLRYGFDAVTRDYFEHYPMPMMVTETGTPYYGYGHLWHDQMLTEAATLVESGLPLLGYTMFPVIDTFGWQCALSCHGGDVGVDTGGLSDLSGRMRPYVTEFLSGLQPARTSPLL
jgi:hypothetical protein